MRKGILSLLITLAFLLVSCSNQSSQSTSSAVQKNNPSSKQESAASPVSSSSGSQHNALSSSSSRIPKIIKPKDSSKLSTKETRYLNFITRIDIITFLAFSKPSEITQTGSYYMYLIIKGFISSERNVSWTEQFYNKQKDMCIIPASDIKQTLKTYLGKEDFDPNKAFEKEIVTTADAEGYHPSEDAYYVIDPEGFGGDRTTGLTGFKDLGNNTYEVTVAFYHDEDTFDAYKTHTVTIKESTNKPGEFTVLNAYYNYYNDDGTVDFVDTPEKLKNVKIVE